MHVRGVAGGRRSLSLSALPARGVGALQMFMCVVSVTITYASNTHTHVHAALMLSNIRWNSLDDHRFFFSLPYPLLSLCIQSHDTPVLASSYCQLPAAQYPKSATVHNTLSESLLFLC